MEAFRAKFKKGTAILLACTMMAGLVAVMPGSAINVKAAGGTTPGVSAYATKEQLMDGTFAPDSNGTATNKGKLVFGKNEDATSQEWYILGQDTGVSGDNTIIFAARPIAKGQVFKYIESDWELDGYDVQEYNPDWKCTYPSGQNISEVGPNHYGASDLRVAMNNMVDGMNTTYFTIAEQGLMNATTVETKDSYNSEAEGKTVTYTTTDKLYALATDGGGSAIIKAGSSNQILLAMDSYWKIKNKPFWLRTPSQNNPYAAWLAAPGGNTSGLFSIYSEQDIRPRPASNLNLSSVLFASAAEAASSDTATSGTIERDSNGEPQAMTLRLGGNSENIGTVTYNTATGDIKVAKGSTTGDVALVVQGNDGTNDWYYSKQIAGTETVHLYDIENESNTPASIDLSDLSLCKIWLETTDITENLTYAVNATEIVSITSVAITDIETPVSNTALDTEASCATTGVSSTTPQITWTPGDTTAGYNTSYTASITLTADTDYEFTDDVAATVLGNAATSVTKNPDGTLTVTYKFDATAKDKLTSNTTPQPITTDNGTAYDVPDTGDNTPLVWLYVLSIISGLGLILTGMKGRKTSKD